MVKMVSTDIDKPGPTFACAMAKLDSISGAVVDVVIDKPHVFCRGSGMHAVAIVRTGMVAGVVNVAIEDYGMGPFSGHRIAAGLDHFAAAKRNVVGWRGRVFLLKAQGLFVLGFLLF